MVKFSKSKSSPAKSSLSENSPLKRKVSGTASRSERALARASVVRKAVERKKSGLRTPPSTPKKAKKKPASPPPKDDDVIDISSEDEAPTSKKPESTKSKTGSGVKRRRSQSVDEEEIEYSKKARSGKRKVVPDNDVDMDDADADDEDDPPLLASPIRMPTNQTGSGPSSEEPSNIQTDAGSSGSPSASNNQTAPRNSNGQADSNSFNGPPFTQFKRRATSDEPSQDGSNPSEAMLKWKELTSRTLTDGRGPRIHMTYAQSMEEYEKHEPPKCAVLDAMGLMTKEHRRILEKAPRWDNSVVWCTDQPTRMWSLDEFKQQQIPSRWLHDFLDMPYYGNEYVNFARYPPNAVLWRPEHDPNNRGNRTAMYISDWEFASGATLNIMIGGVSSCRLIEHFVANGKHSRQITMHPLEGEWERFVTMVGMVFKMDPLEFNTYRNALVFSTISVDPHKFKEATSSKGTFSSGSKKWSPSKKKAAAKDGKLATHSWSRPMFGNVEVPIYDGTGLDFDWNDITSLPRIHEDLAIDTPVLVAHTTSCYSDNNVSLNVQFAIKLA